MSILQAFKLAAGSIKSSKMRSFLTMLGMIIGVASVIIMVGLMQGVTNYVIDSFSDMGTNMITVSVTNTGTRKINQDDMYDIAKENSDIFDGMTPKVSGNYTIKYGTTSINNASVTGVGEDYLDINHYSLSLGRFIQYSDIDSRNNACVIGTYIVEELFDGKSALGETIKINGKTFKVIGVQEEQADSTKNSTDDCIYIPYSVATRMGYSKNITNFTFAAKSTDYVEQGEKVLDTYLYSVYKDEDLYTITSMTKLLDTVNSMTSILSAILSGIAGISLLVAGIGIMNIMLVSVVERTKEIGIRKSLGAKRRNIMWQFVIEAASISTIGGFLGIVIGAVVTISLGNAFGVSAAPTIGSIMLSFGVSAGIGICFGYMPASKAAKLNPIDALRSE